LTTIVVYAHFDQPVIDQGIPQLGSQPIGLFEISPQSSSMNIQLKLIGILNLCSRPLKVSFIAQP